MVEPLNRCDLKKLNEQPPQKRAGLAGTHIPSRLLQAPGPVPCCRLPSPICRPPSRSPALGICWAQTADCAFCTNQDKIANRKSHRRFLIQHGIIPFFTCDFYFYFGLFRVVVENAPRPNMGNLSTNHGLHASTGRSRLDPDSSTTELFDERAGSGHWPVASLTRQTWKARFVPPSVPRSTR